MPNKTDRNDARGLAQIIRTGWYRQVHVKSGPSRMSRSLLVARRTVLCKVRDMENTVRAVLRESGLKVGAPGRKLFATRVRELAETDLSLADITEPFGQTRRQLFEDIDAPLLKPLPAEPYVLAQWRRARVGLDYHVEVAKHFYSAPYRHARAAVEVRVTARTVEIFAKGERIAAHMRGSGNGRHTTINDHMPSSHRRYADWTIECIVAEARNLGPTVQLLCEMILHDRPLPEQGYRSCLGILRLARPYGAERLDAAALRGLEIGARNYGSVKSTLEKKLDGPPLRAPQSTGEGTIDHSNIRGSTYYH